MTHSTNRLVSHAETATGGSSYHRPVWKALREAMESNQDALYSPEVLGHMAVLSPKEFRTDPELVQIRRKMAAADLSVSKWKVAIGKFWRDHIAPNTYEDQLPSGRPNPKSRRNVQQFIDSTHAKVWFDEFSKKVFLRIDGKTAQLDDDSLREWMFLMRESGLPIDKDPASDALCNLALQNKRHPVRDYLKGLKWDGVERVDTWLADYAGAEYTKLNRAFGRKFLIGAVRRIMEPGVKLRAMPILEGEQNIGKSLVFKTLAVRDEWYTDSLELGCDPKEVIELTEGKWIVETPELSGMAKRDVEHVKAMVSRDVDKARLAYGRFSTEVARQFVLGGTTNTDEYLKDRTGNTRFWGVKVGRPNIKALKRDRDQLWAEAVQIEATGEAHWLDDPELQELARKSAQAREEKSPIEQKWIELFKGAHKHGDIFIPTDELYVAMDLKEAAKRTQAHKTSMHYAAKHTGWSLTRKRIDDKRPYGFVPEGADAQMARIATYDRTAERLKVPKVKRRGDGLGQS